jgi:hypothetical protein
LRAALSSPNQQPADLSGLHGQHAVGILGHSNGAQAEEYGRELADPDGQVLEGQISTDTWDGESVLFDSDLERLGLVTEYEHPLLGKVRQFGNLITFSDTPGKQ